MKQCVHIHKAKIIQGQLVFVVWNTCYQINKTLNYDSLKEFTPPAKQIIYMYFLSIPFHLGQHEQISPRTSRERILKTIKQLNN